MIRKSHLDTNTTTSQIMIQLKTLGSFIAKCGHDIFKFDVNVKVILESIKERVDVKNGLPTDLFKGYSAFIN